VALQPGDIPELASIMTTGMLLLDLDALDDLAAGAQCLAFGALPRPRLAHALGRNDG
jgi:hypothetical protein